jgi:hypothetical protein
LDLFQAVKVLWEYCLKNKITLTAEHLPGKQNVLADEQSRVFLDASNWKLDQQFFQGVMTHWGPWTIDLFADRLNAQLPRFASWKPDPEAVQVDAFLMDWKEEQAYAFPPFCLISRCLSKIRKERATVVLIAPVWNAQVWYPQMLEMLTDFPILLPTYPLMLQSPKGEGHPLVMSEHLQLAALKVSGDMTSAQLFQGQLQPLCKMRGGQGPRRLMDMPLWSM